MRRTFSHVGIYVGEGKFIHSPKPGAQVEPEQLISTLKSQLANFKIPKKCFVVPELPRNTMGKVQKNLLREQHKTLFA